VKQIVDERAGYIASAPLGWQILYNPAWRNGLQNDKPEDWGNLLISSPKWLKDWIQVDAPTNSNSNCQNVINGYCADRHGIWRIDRGDASFPYVVTQEQKRLLCGGSCVSLIEGVTPPEFIEAFYNHP